MLLTCAVPDSPEISVALAKSSLGGAVCAEQINSPPTAAPIARLLTSFSRGSACNRPIFKHLLCLCSRNIGLILALKMCCFKQKFSQRKLKGPKEKRTAEWPSVFFTNTVSL